MTTIIASTTDNNVIGFNNDLVIHNKLDMFLFQQVTKNGNVVMGRNTQQSLPKGYLPNRNNLLVSTTVEKPPENFVGVFSSLEDALLHPSSNDNTYIIGGAKLYRHALTHRLASNIILSRFNTIVEGDTYFPTIPPHYTKTKEIVYYDFIGSKLLPVTIEFYKLGT